MANREQELGVGFDERSMDSVMTCSETEDTCGRNFVKRICRAPMRTRQRCRGLRLSSRRDINGSSR